MCHYNTLVLKNLIITPKIFLLYSIRCSFNRFIPRLRALSYFDRNKSRRILNLYRFELKCINWQTSQNRCHLIKEVITTTEKRFSCMNLLFIHA